MLKQFVIPYSWENFMNGVEVYLCPIKTLKSWRWRSDW